MIYLCEQIHTMMKYINIEKEVLKVRDSFVKKL